MSDNHTKEQRSKNMSAIRSSGNKSTELRFLEILKSNKITGWRRHLKKLEGKPDFAFPEKKIAVFLDGCYWHGCKRCNLKAKSNQTYWKKKIENNVRRDSKITNILQTKGWEVYRIWEHDIKSSRYKNYKKVVSLLTKHSLLF